MIDYIRSQNVPLEAKNLNDIISLDELAKDEVQSKHNFIADPTKQTPEQIYLAQERHDDIHRALEMIEAREETCGWSCRGGMSSIEHFCLHPLWKRGLRCPN